MTLDPLNPCRQRDETQTLILAKGSRMESGRPIRSVSFLGKGADLLELLRDNANRPEIESIEVLPDEDGSGGHVIVTFTREMAQWRFWVSEWFDNIVQTIRGK